MTQKQIDYAIAHLPPISEMDDVSTEIKILQTELYIRDYMISCLVYGNDYYQNLSYAGDTYHQPIHLVDATELNKLGVDGVKRVAELWVEMQKDFAEHAMVVRGTHTDSEGLTYNSVYWDD